MARARTGRTRTTRSSGAAARPSSLDAALEPLDAPEPFLSRDGTALGPWQNALALLDDVEEALARSGRALDAHLQVGQVEQRHRQKLLELGDVVARIAHAPGVTLPSDVIKLVEETDQLRLEESAARELALSLSRDERLAQDEEVAQGFTDRLP